MHLRLAAAVALLLSVPLARAASLEGAWVVHLSTDTQPSYTQPMMLVLHADRTVTGRFYGSTIEAGRWKQDRGRTCASFRTSDGVGPYHTAVCLAGDIAQGQTWAEHRDFLFNWNATRAMEADDAPPAGR